MTVLLFLLVFVLCSQVLAFAIALIARSWVWRTTPVVLHGTSVGRAQEVVAAYMEGVSDTRFGFPTGIFRVNEDESAPARLVARELDFNGSTALDLGRFALAIPAAFVAAASDEGCVAGIIALTVAVVAAAFLVVPLVLLGIVEIALRWLMRSRVVAVLEPVGSDQDACSVSFELVGLSAFGLRRSLLGGLAAPELPARWGGATVDTTREPWFHDRLNVVYAAGSAIALVTAIVVIAAVGGGGHGSPNVAFQAPVQTDQGQQDSGDAGSLSAPDTTSEPASQGSGQATEPGSGAQASTAPSAGSEPGPSTSTSTGLVASLTQGDGFTIRRPAGDWVQDHLEVQKPGYIETRWHLAGSPGVLFLVDHTPGYSGTAREGADGVSKSFAHVSSYRRLSFGPQSLPAGDAWRWAYEVDGVHSVDTFLMTCDTGYAVRGAAPVSAWAQYAQVFEEAIATLTPDCS